jgi:hypothetical protein
MSMLADTRSSRLGALRALLPGRKGIGAAMRRYSRHRCYVPAVLTLTGRGYGVDGAVTEVSRGGCLFREASTYILDRRGLPITVRLLDIEVGGTIVNVSPLGYGIRLDSLLDEAIVDSLAETGAEQAEA